MTQRSDELLRVLAAAGVEFVVVGGVAANLHGSSLSTKDLDVVAPLTLDNCDKILTARQAPGHAQRRRTRGVQEPLFSH